MTQVIFLERALECIFGIGELTALRQFLRLQDTPSLNKRWSRGTSDRGHRNSLAVNMSLLSMYVKIQGYPQATASALHHAAQAIFLTFRFSPFSRHRSTQDS
jgi:hypothetical protein